MKFPYKPQTPHGMQLLIRMQAALGEGINSLGSTNYDGLYEAFLFYQAVHLNRAGEGYCFLRSSGRVESSKLLIRPAIETMFKLVAVQKHPELLYQIAFDEKEEDRKWGNTFPKETGQDFQKDLEDYWTKFTQQYAEKYPTHILKAIGLNMMELAIKAELVKFYNSHYRLYCRFTHGATKAITGDLSPLEGMDTVAMLICMLWGLQGISAIGAKIPELEALSEEFKLLQQSDAL